MPLEDASGQVLKEQDRQSKLPVSPTVPQLEASPAATAVTLIAPPAAGEAEVIPPWEPAHPEHQMFLRQLEDDGLVLMTKEDLASQLQQAAQVGEEAESRLIRVTAGAVPRPVNDAWTQTAMVSAVTSS